MKCKCGNKTSDRFCGKCGTEIPCYELRQILIYLESNAARWQRDWDQLTKDREALPEKSPKREAFFIAIERAGAFHDKWQRLADVQAKAIKDLIAYMDHVRLGADPPPDVRGLGDIDDESGMISDEEFDAATDTTSETDA